ncbi:MAG TPA: hypothetical protein VFC93_09725 [Chloroflexota bacterium]|nr:hypothetical protein [Chloroflexota bacterium]
MSAYVVDGEGMVVAASDPSLASALADVGLSPALAPLLARTDPAAGGGVNRAIVLVSDGKETCGGDPVEAARAIRATDPATRIFTVGFRVDPKARDQLRAVADVGGGSYEDASGRDALVEALRKISAKSTTAAPPR